MKRLKNDLKRIPHKRISESVSKAGAALQDVSVAILTMAPALHAKTVDRLMKRVSDLELEILEINHERLVRSGKLLF